MNCYGKFSSSLVLVMTVAAAVRGAVIYDNTANQTGYVLMFNNNQEIGDQITVGNTAAPYLTNFSFEYYSPNAAFSGTVQADVQFYLNDGTPTNGFNTPGTVFYDTGWFNVQTPQEVYGTATNSAVLDFSFLDLLGGATPLNPTMQLPTNFTMTVTFQGLSGTDQVGLNLFDPALVGTNFGDYWLNSGGTWELLTNSTAVAFGMQLNGYGTGTVPEPAVWSLALAGAGLLAGFARRRK